MKTSSSIFSTLAVLLLMASCTADDVATPVINRNDGQVYTYKMNLNIAAVPSVPSDLQSDPAATRAVTNEWPEGSKLQFQFSTNSGTIPGTATYSKVNDEWTVTTNESLTPTSTALTCSATYLPDGSTQPFLVRAYDGSSEYSFDGTTVSVNAFTLDAATWRLRFSGNSGQALAFFSKDVRDYSGQSMTDSLRLTVASNGYTPYVYVTFASGSSNDSICVRTDALYTRAMMGRSLGSSITIPLPTSTNIGDWTAVKEPLPAVEREAVDLGLPSGTLWANMNVGASRPEEYGDYYAWGETSPKEVYDWNTYKWCNGSETTMTKYCTVSSYGTVDNKTELELADDAARANWGGQWVMPTYDEIVELVNNTTSEWTTVNGINGRRFTSKTNGNSIFLPAAGWRDGSSLITQAQYGLYWSAAVNPLHSSIAHRLSFGSGSVGTDFNTRYGGQSVRPVLMNYKTTTSPASFTLYGEAESKEIAITSNEPWTASVSSDATSWCHIDRTSGNNSYNLTVTVDANTTGNPRTAYITITGTNSNSYNYITVTQNSKQQTPPDTENIQTITANGVSFKMIRVEHGSFTMGSNDVDNEKWAHTVNLTTDYYIAETEVTQELWRAVMGQTQRPNSNSQFIQWNDTYGLGDQYPAYYLSWDDCQNFITRLNELTQREFRLPTEAEWNFAARGGNLSKGYKFAGSNTCSEVAWYNANSLELGTTHPDYGSHPVKTKQPNELGLYDMSGNVKEWCADYYQNGYGTGTFPQTDPKGPTSGTGRVLRGGSWGSNESFCRLSGRDSSSPTNQQNGNGFRLVFTAGK